ncbi:MAG TPA: hypothetical protein VLV76_07240, partial [Candidatus Acidoferrum sp.]|nr:hypothetical protein [Candidatus Acidoferrum sp.]
QTFRQVLVVVDDHDANGLRRHANSPLARSVGKSRSATGRTVIVAAERKTLVTDSYWSKCIGNFAGI